MKRWRLAVVMAAAMSVIAIGCGEEDDASGKAEFVQQAHAVCDERRSNLLGRYSAYAEENRRPGESRAELSGRIFVEVQIPNMEAELAALRELEAPEGDGADLEAFFTAEQAAIDAAAETGDDESREEMKQRFDMAAKLAQAYGIPRCANPSSGLLGD